MTAPEQLLPADAEFDVAQEIDVHRQELAAAVSAALQAVAEADHRLLTLCCGLDSELIGRDGDDAQDELADAARALRNVQRIITLPGAETQTEYVRREGDGQ